MAGGRGEQELSELVPAPRGGRVFEREMLPGLADAAGSGRVRLDAILSEHGEQVEAYRGGKEGLLGFFVGQVMRETGGKASPQVVNERLREKLRA